MRIAILADSSSGLINREKDNIFVLPLPIIFPNGEIINDEITNIKNQNVILNSIEKVNLKSSFLNSEILVDKISEILKDYDIVIYLPIAYNLSSQYENSLVLMQEEKYKNRLFIVKHYFTGIQLKNFVFNLIEYYQDSKKATKTSINFLVKEWERKSLLAVIPGNFKNLSKSGRVSKLIINFFDKRNLKVGIFWSTKPKKIIAKNYDNLLDKYIKYINKNYNGKSYEIYLAYNEFCDQKNVLVIENKLKNFNYKIVPLPTIFAVHGGNNTIGLVIIEK